MMIKLTWSALMFAALAALACWNREGQPVCHESRPLFGAGACCQRHRVAGRTAADFEAVDAAWRVAWRAHVSRLARP
jgi:hypothetical protein